MDGTLNLWTGLDDIFHCDLLSLVLGMNWTFWMVWSWSKVCYYGSFIIFCIFWLRIWFWLLIMFFVETQEWAKFLCFGTFLSIHMTDMALWEEVCSSIGCCWLGNLILTSSDKGLLKLKLKSSHPILIDPALLTTCCWGYSQFLWSVIIIFQSHFLHC